MEFYVLRLVLVGTLSIALLYYGAIVAWESDSKTRTSSIGIDIPTVSFLLGFMGLMQFAKYGLNFVILLSFQAHVWIYRFIWRLKYEFKYFTNQPKLICLKQASK